MALWMLTSERKITPTRYSPSRSGLVDHIKKVFPKHFYRNDFDVKMKKGGTYSNKMQRQRDLMGEGEGIFSKERD